MNAAARECVPLEALEITFLCGAAAAGMVLDPI